MALPNGDLITTVFDPQMAYPVDKRMQVDTLNSRDSMSMFIRWEGMEVYVLENSKKYILQGGRSNEYWKENGTGTGTGGTTFVGQFESADLLPTSGRSAGDYAFVGTGDDFVQYNWDNISNEWVIQAETNLSAFDFYQNGQKTIYVKGPKDIIITDEGNIIASPEFMGNLVFTKPFNLRGVVDALGDKEFTIENSSGEPGTIQANYVGGPANSAFNIPETITIQNGEKLTFKSEDGKWVVSQNSGEVAWSDHLDAVGAVRSVGPDGLEVISGINDRYTKGNISYKEITEVPTLVDGIINIYQNSKYYKRVLKEYNLGEFNVLPENSASVNAANFAFAQTVIPHDSKVILPTGEYRMDDVEIIKSGIYDFSGVTLINDMEVAGQFIRVHEDADFVNIIGANVKYEGMFYTTNPDFTGTRGVIKNGINARNKKTVLTNCRANGFSEIGFTAASNNESFYVIGCVSSHNGYGGVKSLGSDFQVFGGEYSYNGGAVITTGYGVIGNIANRGIFKCIGVTSVGNATRNIDSHQGVDIIISNNYTSDAGQPHPQWFDRKSADGLNIRATQRIDRCIISGNIAKRATLAGISISGDDAVNDYLRNIVITNNILEDNYYQIHFRQSKTNDIKIQGNKEVNTSDPENVVNRGLIINPSGNDSNLYINNLSITDNSFDSTSDINLSSGTIPAEISIANNFFKRNLNIFCTDNEAAINVVANTFRNFSAFNGGSKSVLNFAGNKVDANGEDLAYDLDSSYGGYIQAVGNVFQNSIATTQIFIPSNSFFRNNLFIINHEISPGTSGSVIRIQNQNCEVSGNKIIFNSVTPFIRVFRITARENIIIKDNIFSGSSRIDHPGGSLTATKLLWDPKNGIYDFGTSAIPDFGTYDGFKRGDQLKINNVTLGGFVGYVCITGGEGPTWEKYGIIGFQGVEQAPAITTTFDLTTPPTESFHVFNTNANDFNGSPDDSRDWFIRRVRGTPNQTAIDIAVDRNNGRLFTKTYVAGSWTGWVSGFQLDENGNAVIANTKKVGNGVANSENWIQYGNGANIYNVPTGQQHIFRQNGATVAGISGDGKFFVEGVGKGIILKSPDGTQYEITVPNGGGSLTVTEV